MSRKLSKLSVLVVTLWSSTSLLLASEVGIYMPYGITNTALGSQLIVDTYANRVLEVKGDTVTLVAGKQDVNGGLKDAGIREAYFDQPLDVVQNSKKDIFVSDSENHAIRRIVDGEVLTLAGTGNEGYEDGDRKVAKFNLPSGLAVDAKDNLYVADTLNHAIRKISPEGIVSTLTGTGISGYKDGSLGEALFNEPTDVVVDKDILYIVDSGNQAIRKIEKNQVTTVAGGRTAVNPTTGYKKGGYVDGVNAQFNFPKSLIVLENGELLVADTLNNAIRKIKEDGTVVTVLSVNSNLGAPVGLVYKDGKIMVSQKWKEKVTSFELEPEHSVKSSLTREQWLTETPFLPKSEEVQLWFEGVQILPNDVKPQFVKSQIYLPVRVIAEVAGAKVEWDQETKAATVTLGNQVVKIPNSGENVINVNGRMLVGVRFLAESLGLKVDWVADYRAVVITK